MADHDVLVLDLSDVPMLGVTASLAIENAIKDAVEQGRHVFIVGATGSVQRRLEKLGIFDLLPPQNLMTDRLAALRQAVALVNSNDRVTADVGSASSQGLSDFTDPALQQ
jgi:sulfate permease, SulP family